MLGLKLSAIDCQCTSSLLIGIFHNSIVTPYHAKILVVPSWYTILYSDVHPYLVSGYFPWIPMVSWGYELPYRAYNILIHFIPMVITPAAHPAVPCWLIPGRHQHPRFCAAPECQSSDCCWPEVWHGGSSFFVV